MIFFLRKPWVSTFFCDFILGYLYVAVFDIVWVIRQPNFVKHTWRENERKLSNVGNCPGESELRMIDYHECHELSRQEGLAFKITHEFTKGRFNQILFPFETRDLFTTDRYGCPSTSTDGRRRKSSWRRRTLTWTWEAPVFEASHGPIDLDLVRVINHKSCWTCWNNTC